MIKKASELLERFIAVEVEKLSGVNMLHMPTLGSAYEEITRQGIFQDYAIPKDLDLRVVSGFISVSGEMLPEQIDCMLVHGDGQQYGLTQQYIYDVNKVLCFFEVKKNLKKADYADAIGHLAKIRRKFADSFEERLVSEDYEPDITVARMRFAQITGRAAPERYRDINGLSVADGVLFYCLVQESLAPVAIIHGYEGYKTEYGLRTAFIDFLDENKSKGGEGFGVPSIPALVTSNQFCLVKANGIPFLGVGEFGEWVPVVSTRYNSAKLILEIIWSKISIYFNLKMPWDDGLYIDNAEPLLIAKAVEEGGWLLRPYEPKERDLKRDDNLCWAPAKLGEAEISAVNIMAFKAGYLPLDKEMEDYLQEKHGVPLKTVVDNLVRTREFMLDGDCVRPVHGVTYVLTADDGTGFVASEVERLDLWCAENDVEPHYMSMWFVDE
ncbi:hypothetical protein APA66_24330 [Pseudomonas aeruginosa]|uniref:DUF6602 domain-containing protein n=1 Tax=Pseudomonas aeruginosa TaxID=287 RepID=UPI00053EA32B|nr:DUF6602 domain-containing protein [Pseudomonas aeruginosa]ALY44149.1 hypothetical protein HW09_25385 [Pseudomonas aeruginosa]KSM49138.1 hypothetical protein APA66_24330 [Pseudomonas aeruginosa]MBH8996659.1 hypothetical protein [Pseudomonas aeruginosa]MBI8521675.1 hypothetical protein [Pseudomonas aeruginosa]MCT4979451.1 hypothetical protein [Pseudomonas aeruginosa]